MYDNILCLTCPAVNRSMGSIQDQLSAIVAQRVTATDNVVREGIAQILQTRVGPFNLLLSSSLKTACYRTRTGQKFFNDNIVLIMFNTHTHTQGLSEMIGGAVASSLQRVIMTRYEEAFKATVLPGFEKACQEMFRQIDDAFRRGTTECELLRVYVIVTIVWTRVIDVPLYISADIGQLSQHNRQLADSTFQQVSSSIHLLVAGGQGSPLHTQLQACLRQEMTTVVQQ